jgi:chemotaxis protein histidine kinase CheA
MGATGILDFFTLEAAEYLERLDGLLAKAGAGVPALEPFLTDAKALRGSATMAKQEAIADVASGLERVARSVRDGSLSWDAALRGAVIAAVDDLKILLRSVRAWGPAEHQRALARRDELARLAPVRTRPSTGILTPGGSYAYLAAEATDIANASEAFADNPADRGVLLDALPRVRALRGMASLRDLPPLPDVLDAIEDVGKPIELGTVPSGVESLAVLRAAAAVLRRAARELRDGQRPDPTSTEAQRFVASVEATGARTREDDRVVPIASLFFDDAGPHLVTATPNPPTTPRQRFRMEVVSQAEHLQGLVGDAKASVDPTARARSARALHVAMLALRATADSFGEADVAGFFERYVRAVPVLDSPTLNALAEAARLLSDPRTESLQLAERLRLLASGQVVDTAIGAGLSRVTAPTPLSISRTEPRLDAVFQTAGSAQPAGSARTTGTTAGPHRATPKGADLRALLASGLEGLTTLSREPLAPPITIEDDSTSIDELVYRGRAALERAIELRNAIRQRGGTPETGELEEIFALLELAAG